MNATLNEREIFQNALDLPTERRTSYLNEVCGDNQELRASIDRLIDANSEAASFLEGTPPGLTLVVSSDVSEDGPPKFDFLTPSSKSGCMGTIGQYEIVGVIGRGRLRHRLSCL